MCTMELTVGQTIKWTISDKPSLSSNSLATRILSQTVNFLQLKFPIYSTSISKWDRNKGRQTWGIIKLPKEDLIRCSLVTQEFLNMECNRVLLKMDLLILVSKPHKTSLTDTETYLTRNRLWLYSLFYSLVFINLKGKKYLLNKLK